MEEIPQEKKEKWGKVTKGHLEISEIMCRQDGKKNVEKIIFTLKNNACPKITWTPEVETLDLTGLIPTTTTRKEEIKQKELPAIVFQIAEEIKDKGVCNIECDYRTIEKEKYTTLFFKAEDLKSIKLL